MPIGMSSGSFWHRTRRDAIAADVEAMLAVLEVTDNGTEP
jgi:hypothetical protein